MENISQFIRVAKNMGLEPSSCFDTVDLYKGNDIGKVVKSIHAFGSAVQANVKSFKGPHLGVKLAQANKRDFTEEQLREGRSATSKLTQGSSAHMERSEVTKQGITFGNTAAGGAGSSEVTKQISGSAGVMQRSEVTKQGITFGNKAAGGAGSSEVTKQISGSAGVMQRSEVTKPGHYLWEHGRGRRRLVGSDQANLWLGWGHAALGSHQAGHYLWEHGRGRLWLV